MSLNKAERLEKERADNAVEVESVRLEPAFPYKMKRFDPTFFDRAKKIKKKTN
tara:strand:+ start:698 stop:856 length:159 start_codon:yes stop_codon:yes gene_type:complete